MKSFYIIFIALLAPVMGFSQLITGSVKSTTNEPLTGITVAIEGTNIRTSTNQNGQFEIEVNDPFSTLQFSGTNVDPLETKLEGRKYISVFLTTKVNKLDEVQVIAYGTSTQRFNVGSVTKISSEDISKQAVSNPLSALQGRVPGLVVSQTSGIPGASVKVQIRGQNILNANPSAMAPVDNPLYIIDGVPFAPQNGDINQFSSIASPGIGAYLNNSYGGLSPFNSINPADIESIEVLRDADATAIYGSRGGNGVILITTKKGKAGKTDFKLNASTGISFLGNTMPMMNTEQYLEMRREAFKNDGITPNLMPNDPGYAPDLLVFDNTRSVDWMKYFTGKSANNTNLYASLSGGTANTKFHLGSGYNRDTYIFPGGYSDNRASFIANLNHVSVDKKLTVDFSSTFSHTKNNSSGAPDLLRAFIMEPNYPSLTKDNGELVWDFNDLPVGINGGYNPLAYLKNRYNVQNSNLNGSLLVGYRVIKNLILRSSFGYSSYNSKEYNGNPKESQDPYNNPLASARFGNNNFNTWIIEPQLEYKNSDDKSHIGILLGGTFQRNSNYKSEVNGEGYINDDLIESISGAPDKYATDAYSEYKYVALFGRINYRYNNKYLINLSVRRDGSSRFGPSKQFGNFGSIGAGWLFAEESTIKDNFPVITYGKIRASYGIAGSDGVSDYQYISRWAPTSYSFDEKIGYAPQNLYNPKFSWGTTKKLEFGLELGFLKDKILISTTWYRNRSGDQLINYTLPTQTGFNNVVENWNAVVQNSGLEAVLQFVNVKRSHFSWNTAVNLTIPKNKLLSFPNIEKSSYFYIYTVGQSLGVLNKVRYAGVNETTGIFEFYDANGQLTYNPVLPGGGKLNDYVNIGNLDPKLYGGLQNTFTYKGIQLDVFVEFKKQLGVNYLSQIYSFYPGSKFNQPTEVLKRWQKPGDKSDIQRFTSQLSDAARIAREIFINSNGVYSDASYIKFKTITCSYNLPHQFIRKFKIDNLRIYATAQNLFTIAGYKGNDPETQSFYGVPPLKMITCGIQLTL